MRAKGDGSVYFDNSRQKWIAKLSIGTRPNGQLRYTKRSCSSKSQAETVLRKMVAERENLRLTSGSTETLQAFAHYYYDHAGLQKLRGTTRSNYLHLLNRHVFNVLGSKRMASITKRDVEALLYGLRSRYSASTVNHVRAILRRLFQIAVEEELLPRNPVALIPKFRREEFDHTQVQPAWSSEEILRAFQCAEGDPIELFLHLVVATGMRRGEALGLKWDDISLEEGTAYIQRTRVDLTTVMPNGRGITKATDQLPKTAKSKRVVLLAPKILDLLHLQRASQQLDRIAAGDSWEEHDYVFATKVGRAVLGSTMYQRYRRFTAKHGLRYNRIHDLRHAYATNGLIQGQRLEAISEQLGHSSIRITKDTYAGSVPALSRESAIATSKALYPDRPIEPPRRDQVAGASSRRVKQRLTA